MQQKRFAAFDREVGVIGLGTWQLGADWGEVTETDARAVLEAAYETGVRFYDTADVYGDGRSERILGRFAADHDDVLIATKMGRRLEQLPEHYSLENFRAWTARSREKLGVERLELVQLHCPPSSVYDSDAVFDALGQLVEEGAIRSWGVSVERCEEALRALDRPGLASIQIILNAFRLKPLEQVVPQALEREVAIIARVPLASGLLSSRYRLDTRFAADDHRSFNRHGEAFDVGETFSGVDYAAGVAAAEAFAEDVARLVPELTPAQAALAWLAQQPGVTTVIPGARSAEQARANAHAGTAAPLPAELDRGIRERYQRVFAPTVHQRW